MMTAVEKALREAGFGFYRTVSGRTVVYAHTAKDMENVPGKETTMTNLYVDETGTDQKPNPVIDVFQEFPLAMLEIARVTAYGAEKHAPRGWQTFDPEYGVRYHTGKLGRHLLKEETEGLVNREDGGLLHPAQVAWNALARLEHMLRKMESDAAVSRDADAEAALQQQPSRRRRHRHASYCAANNWRGPCDCGIREEEERLRDTYCP